MEQAMTPEECLAVRSRLGMTQSEMAHALGVSLVTFWKWESGQVPISASRAIAIRLFRDSQKVRRAK